MPEELPSSPPLSLSVCVRDFYQKEMPLSVATKTPTLSVRASKSTLTVLFLGLLFRYRGVQLPYSLKFIWGILLLISWKNLPTVWHFLTFGPLGTVLFRRWLSYWGLYTPKTGERAKELGFPKEDYYISAIGNSLFSPEAVVLTSHYVGFADSDFVC